MPRAADGGADSPTHGTARTGARRGSAGSAGVLLGDEHPLQGVELFEHPARAADDAGQWVVGDVDRHLGRLRHAGRARPARRHQPARSPGP